MANLLNLTFLKFQFSVPLVKGALIFKSPKSSVSEVTEQLAWLAIVKKVDILLRGFNINTLSNEVYKAVLKVLTESEVMVTESTHVDGGLLNGSHFLKQFLVTKHINGGLY